MIITNNMPPIHIPIIFGKLQIFQSHFSDVICVYILLFLIEYYFSGYAIQNMGT